MKKTDSEVVDSMFKKLIEMDTLLNKMDQKLDGKADKSDIERLENTVDDFAGKLADHDGEAAALISQTSRHEAQIEYLAGAVGADLSNVST